MKYGFNWYFFNCGITVKEDIGINIFYFIDSSTVIKKLILL